MILAWLVGVARAGTLLVAADGSGDFTSIQAAIDAASPGDLIQVRNGVYTEGTVVPYANTSIDIGALLVIDRAVTVIGESVGGVIVRAGMPVQERMTALFFDNGTYGATVDGMTFDHLDAGTEGGTYAYSAVQLAQDYNALGGTLEVRNVVFRMPAAHPKSVAYVNTSQARFTLRHITADFGTVTPGSFGYVNYVDGSSALVDSILLNADCGWINFGFPVGPQFAVRTTDSWGCTPPAGAGNLDVDPLVVDRSAGDYRLQAGSPVADLAAEPPALDPQGGPADLGAFGAARPAADALTWPAGRAARVTNASATLAFEDLVDAGSDEDLNDLVLRYVASCRVGVGDGRLLDQIVDFAPVAAGASKINGLRLRPVDVPDRVEWAVGAGGAIEICGPATAPCGAEIALYDDFRDAFVGAPTGFVNTTGATVYPGYGHAMRLQWDAGPIVGGACPEPDFVLVRPAEAVTVDDTSALPGGVPLAGRFPGDWAVPSEHTAVGSAYPGLLQWLDEVAAGCSGPCAHDDWYAAPGALVVARSDLDATAPLAPPPSCSDGLRNQDEPHTDCGGSVCPACP